MEPHTGLVSLGVPPPPNLSNSSGRTCCFSCHRASKVEAHELTQRLLSTQEPNRNTDFDIHSSCPKLRPGTHRKCPKPKTQTERQRPDDPGRHKPCRGGGHLAKVIRTLGVPAAGAASISSSDSGSVVPHESTSVSDDSGVRKGHIGSLGRVLPGNSRNEARAFPHRPGGGGSGGGCAFVTCTAPATPTLRREMKEGPCPASAIPSSFLFRISVYSGTTISLILKPKA